MLGVLLAIEGGVVFGGSLILGLVCAGIGYWWGEKKSRGVVGLLLGFFLSIIGLIILYFVPAKHDDTAGGYAPPPAPS